MRNGLHDVGSRVEQLADRVQSIKREVACLEPLRAIWRRLQVQPPADSAEAIALLEESVDSLLANFGSLEPQLDEIQSSLHQ